MREEELTNEEFRGLAEILLQYLCPECLEAWGELLGEEEEDE